MIAVFEDVVVDVVVPTSQANADPVLDVSERVLVYLGVERFEDGEPGIFHVVDVVS